MNSTAAFDTRTWMGQVLDIEQLKLTDIIWPGSHNSGMDKQAPNYRLVPGNWTTCQNGSFAWQLERGARAFDLRLGFTANSTRPMFYFHHNGYESQRLLDELVEALTAFLERHPDEFVVLDFHQLGDGEKPFDHLQLNDFLMRRLGSQLIPFSDAMCTVGELKGASAERRIVLAARYAPGLDNQFFWPPITHKWTRQRLTDIATLQRHIETTLRDAPYESFIWSLPVTCYTLLGGPSDISHKINDWFHTTRDWVTRCSIISTDFFDQSDIVRYCWVANSMKAVYGRGLHESG